MAVTLIPQTTDCQSNLGTNKYQAPYCANPNPLMCTAGAGTMVADGSKDTVVQAPQTSSQNRSNGSEGTTLVQNTSQTINASSGYEVYTPMYYPVPMTTATTGRSQGGARTTTHTSYEEHTVTNGEQFTSGEDWRTATAVDSTHAADLWFGYVVRNTGTEFAHEICNLTFNIYIGDMDDQIYSYFVPAVRGGTCFTS